MRDSSISISKGIAIMLMVLAHSRFSVWGNQYINMFHMPLFFFFAGYCFKEKYLHDARDFVFKRMKGLYKPYVKWSLLFLLFHNLFYHLNIYNGEYGFQGQVSNLYGLKDYISRALHIVTSMSGNEQLLGGFWFLKSLFVGSLLAYIAIRVSRLPLCMGVFLLISVLMTALEFHVPYFGIGGREFLAAFFFLFGYWYKVRGFRFENNKALTIPVGLGVVAGGTIFWQCSMGGTMIWYKVIPFACSAIAGTLAVFSLSKIIASHDGATTRFLTYVGDNTITILTWHLLCFKTISLAIIYIYGLSSARLAEFPAIEEYAYRGWFVLYFLAGTLIPLVFSKVRFLQK